MTRETETAFVHGMADVEPGVRLHYVTAGEGDRTAVLFHGFPQTWYAWHGFIPRLTAAGFRVIAVDYRGAATRRVRSGAMTSGPWRRTSAAWCATRSGSAARL
jgi:pimeloyl-ACP methyl ester carboxylesterase